MDLISREAAIEALGECPENWTDTPEEIEAVNSWCFAADVINSVPSVDAVPLDKLCEMLDKYNVTVPCNDDCEGCEAFDGTGDTINCWKVTLAKWMEEQDADRQ